MFFNDFLGEIFHELDQLILGPHLVPSPVIEENFTPFYQKNLNIPLYNIIYPWWLVSHHGIHDWYVYSLYIYIYITYIYTQYFNPHMMDKSHIRSYQKQFNWKRSHRMRDLTRKGKTINRGDTLMVVLWWFNYKTIGKLWFNHYKWWFNGDLMV